MIDPVNFWIAEIVLKLLFTLGAVFVVVVSLVIHSLLSDWKAQRRRLKRQATCTHEVSAKVFNGERYCVTCGKHLS